MPYIASVHPPHAVSHKRCVMEERNSKYKIFSAWESIPGKNFGFFLLWKLCTDYQEYYMSYIYNKLSPPKLCLLKIFNSRIFHSAKFPWEKLSGRLYFIKEAQGASKLIWQKFSNVTRDVMILHLHHSEKCIYAFNTEYTLNSWKFCCEGPSERN
jgi:hypothetical protein